MRKMMIVSNTLQEAKRPVDYLFMRNPSNHKTTRKCRTKLRRNMEESFARQRKLLSSPSVAILICSSFFTLFSQVTAADSLLEPAAKLPTVIVRGFLNYRTTVDGTVLLFTPDAGGPGSTVASISATPVPQQPLPPPQTASKFRPQVYAAAEEKQQPDAAADQWRPIQATPPLRQPAGGAQTSHFHSAKPSDSSSTTLISSAGRDEPPSSESSSSAKPSSASNNNNKPTVQTDELEANDRPQPTRAKARGRPSLGFFGQGARSISRPTGQQAADSSSINGIRRPTLSTSPAPASADQQPDTGSQAAQQMPVVSSAFQARLQSAKLRNKFRKPGSSALGNSSSSTLTSQAASSNSDDLHQVGSSSMSATTNVAAAGNQWPVAAELQPRAGDIFNPSAGPLAVAPAVGSDEILIDSSSSSSADSKSADEADKLESRIGEQRPGGSSSRASSSAAGETPELLTGGLTGSIETGSGAPLTFDSFFQSDQPAPVSSKPPAAAASEHRPNHLAPRKKAAAQHNDKINGWLDHHHNKFVPRPAPSIAAPPVQLNLTPSFASNIPSISPAPTPSPTPASSSAATAHLESAGLTKPAVGSAPEAEPELVGHPSGGNTTLAESAPPVNGSEALQMQTITKTYSTVMTSLKTRLVPLQVKSSTGVHTLTESYVITKLMTAYQTMPVGEFILPEPLGSRAPFEIFNEPASSDQSIEQQAARKQQAEPVPAPSNFAAPQLQQEPQEQPITLQENSQKSPNDWLHDFASQNPFNPSASNQQQQQHQQQLTNLLEQQSQETNLANLLAASGEPLDQLASGLDPATLLADGSISIPDLNNPLVLAAAIQNPQLAAVILAAQQLRLRQQQQQRAKQPNNQAQPSLVQLQLQPSYSTSLSTTIRPSTYTVRDTMYTTRLVSFKDGRTVRTRTVSEPGSVIEQVLTTMATEVTPVTITIRPTGVLAAPSTQATAAAASNNQATLNNALFATQLASLLARRQQQVQPSSGGLPAAQSNQLTLLQQLLAGQQSAAARPQQQQQQFQPNLQQLLQSMQQQQQQQQHHQPSNQQQPAARLQPQASDSSGGQQEQPSTAANMKPESSTAATPPLPALPSKPIVTTLTSLQVRTYTVHNAFKTIYRTITSTQLVTSTILPALAAMRNSQLPMLG